MIYEIYSEEKKYVSRIRELREDSDFTQQYVADYLCTSQTMYARYERDASALPIRFLFYLSKLYGVSTDYILGLTDVKTPVSALVLNESAAAEHQITYSDKFDFHWK